MKLISADRITMPTLALNASSRRPNSVQPSTERATLAKAEAAYDATLIQRFLADEESAFIEIMQRHREKVYGLTFALLRNRGDAEEITQDTFIRAHRGLANFRGDSSLTTWLNRIAVNLARNRYWYFFRRRRHLTLSLDCPVSADHDTTFTEFVSSDEQDPAREAVSAEFAALVASCMEKLEPSQREILTLRNQLHRPYEEIAATLNLNVGTVKSRIARARGNLRTLLAEMCPEFAPDAEPSSWFESGRAFGQTRLASA